jgi:hypothetical protein
MLRPIIVLCQFSDIILSRCLPSLKQSLRLSLRARVARFRG